MFSATHGSTMSRRLAAVVATALFGLALALNPGSAPRADAAVSPWVGNRAVNVAAAQIGVRYVWGGASRYGFDCSGLTQYAYRRAGRYIPRTALGQYWATTHVSRHSARRGDLVFLVRGGGVPHVGIYLGYGYMIAAPHRNARVREQRIMSGHVVFGRVR